MNCPMCNGLLYEDGLFLSCRFDDQNHRVYADDAGYDINIGRAKDYRFDSKFYIQSNREGKAVFMAEGKIVFHIEHFIPIDQIKPYVDKLIKLQAFL